MSTLNELTVEVERLASEAANARGDGKLALDFIRGTPHKDGINSRLDRHGSEIGFIKDREQERQQTNEVWFRKLDERFDALERRMVHPFAVWLIALSLVGASSAACWSVFGPKLQEQYAVVMGCEHP